MHGFLHEAIETALLASDYAGVLRMGAPPIISLLLEGQYHIVSRWLRQLPEHLFMEIPDACLALVWTYLLSGQSAETQALLRQAERLFTSHEDHIGLGRVASTRAMLASRQDAGDIAVNAGKEAIALLPEDALHLRNIAIMALGWGHCLQGDVALARQTLIEARLLSEQSGNTALLAECTLLAGKVLTLQGKLAQAIPCYQAVLTDQQAWSPFSIEALIQLGTLLLEWNDLSGAEAQVEQALRFSHQRKETHLTARCALLQARILQASGRSGELIEEAFIRAIVLARQSKHPFLLDLAYAYQARWWLASGNKEAVPQWYATYGANVEATPTQRGGYSAHCSTSTD